MRRQIYLVILVLVMFSFVVGCLKASPSTTPQPTATSPPIDSTAESPTDAETDPIHSSDDPSTSLSSSEAADPAISSSPDTDTITKAPTGSAASDPVTTLAPTASPIPSATPIPTASPIPTATPAPTATPVPSSTTLEGEFVAINVYMVTEIKYYRAILMNGSNITLLTCLGTPYQTFYSSSTGLKTIIEFYMKDEKFRMNLSAREYAYGTSLETVYLASASKDIYIGHTGVNIRVTGNMTTASQPTLSGVAIFSVTECDKIT